MEFQSDYSKIKHLVDYEGLDKLEFSDERGTIQSGGAENCGQDGGATAQNEGATAQNEGYAQVGNMLGDLDGFEKDFFEIFKKAREYRNRINNSLGGKEESQLGGEDKPKKKLNPVIAMTVETGKRVRANKEVQTLLKDKKLKNTDIFKIGGMIIKEAKKIVADRKKVSVDELKGTDPDVMAEYKKLAENYMKYVNQLVATNARSMSRLSKGKRARFYMY